MPSDLPFLSLVVPALGMALDALGRADEAAMLRRAEQLVRELAAATGERRVALRAELTELARGLGARLRALCPEDLLTEGDAERLARELARLAAETPPAPHTPEASP
ncbi:MAG TPA: hypothetical protein VFS00_32060 [Polyangiaceae bacterium]|nr:hypothetical protein [Polyangiaceae bacterium]